MNGLLDSLKNFCGKILIQLTDLSGSPVLAVLIYVLAVSIFCFVSSTKNYENLFIDEMILNDLEVLKGKKHKKTSMADDISKLIAKYRYNTIQPIICLVEEWFFGQGMVVAYKNPETSTYVGNILGLKLNESVVKLLKEQNSTVAIAFAFVAFAVVLQMGHDVFYEKYHFTDTRILDFSLWVLLFILFIVYPIVFAVYWVFHEIVDIGIFYYVHNYGRKNFDSRFKINENGFFYDKD